MSKQNRMYISVFLGCFLLCSLCSCLSSKNFIGLSREEIINEIGKYPRFTINNQKKIMICVNSSFKYYDSPSDIHKDKHVMDSKVWEIAFERTFFGKKFIKIVFDNNNIVIKQNAGTLNDGP